MTDIDINIEERLNDEGFAINRGFDSEEGYNVLAKLGIPPTITGNGMGVGEYNSKSYSKVSGQEKIREEGVKIDNNKSDQKKYEIHNGDKNLLGYI